MEPKNAENRGGTGPGTARKEPCTSLRVWNALLAAAHAAQGVRHPPARERATIPITWSYIDGPPATGAEQTDTLYDLPFGPAVAAFVFLAAIDHGAMAAPRVVEWYERNLAAEMNPARWWEYSVSASLMIVLIAMLTGLRDVGALIALFGVNAAMILFGLVMERVNRPGRPVDCGRSSTARSSEPFCGSPSACNSAMQRRRRMFRAS